MRSRSLVPLALALILTLPLTAAAPRAPSDAVLDALTQELARAAGVYARQTPSAYFVGYEAWDDYSIGVRAQDGAASEADTSHTRRMVADVRVGDYRMDSMHPIQGPMGSLYQAMSGGARTLPLTDDAWALRAAVWQESERRLRAASQRYTQAVANRAASATPSDTSPDFSHDAPLVRVEAVPALPVVDMSAWSGRLARVSARLADGPGVYGSDARLSAQRELRWIVNSEGTRVRTGTTHVRVFIMAQTRSADGSELHLYRSFDAQSAAGMPSEARLLLSADSLVADLQALRAAPEAEPYNGPAIMGGEAAAVFFHEIFGHRVEGHRQKDENFAQTFTAKLGQQVLPAWMSVVDDPTLASYAGVDLMGHYTVDDEGIAARRTPVVSDGKLVGFLMGRTPIRAEATSNGHGRRQTGTALVVARQGNLIVSSARAVTPTALRQQLIDEVKRQGKPYGLYFEQVEGGFTFTGRYLPQSFKVLPLKVWRIYPDGRPDQLIRGADLEGTPLAAFASILATDNDIRVFNGYCGAESGSVPVSGASPAVLLSQIEVSKKAKPMERPPVLAPPRVAAPPTVAAPGDAAAGDVLLRALGDELRRSADSLALPGLARPYLVRYRVSDTRGVGAAAALGAIVSQSWGHTRMLSTEVRVGSMRGDNGNFSDPVAFSMPFAQLPDADDYTAVREGAWRATDAAYRGAVEALARKQAVLATQPPDTLPSYTSAPPVQLLLPPAGVPPDTGSVNRLVRRASLVFREFPAVDESRVSFSASAVTHYVLASDGTRVRWPAGTGALIIDASGHTPSGQTLSQARRIDVPAGTVPDTATVLAAARELGRQLSARVAGPPLERYRGPILFESQAAARLFADLLGRRVTGTPEATTSAQFAAASAMFRSPGAALGDRVLPPGFDVTDDPTPESAAGIPLAGHYPVDDEGVSASAVKVVENGLVRQLLASRIPGPEAAASNGHGRASYFSPEPRAAMATLWVSAPQPRDAAELRKELLARAAAQGLGYALVVRALSAPPRSSLFGPGGGLQMPQMPNPAAGATLSAVAVRVYPDGHEEPVPDLLLTGLTPRLLERILAAGDRPLPTTVSVPVSIPGMMFSFDALGMDSPAGLPGSVVTPALLVDDVEGSQRRGTERPPLLPHPFFEQRR